MEIWLMRHPEVAVEPGTCYGRTDVPLAEGYRERLALKRSMLPNLESMNTLSSPASRCRLAAELLAPAGFQLDDRLLELDFGSWEMRAWSQLPREDLNAWSHDLHGATPHGGESGDQLMERCHNLMAELRQTAESVFMVTHSGVIHAALAIVLEIDLAHAYRIDVDYHGLTLLKLRGDHFQVHFVNR